MATNVQDPKDEIEALRAALAEREEALAARDARIAALTTKVVGLEHNVALYTRLLFGKSSEKRGGVEEQKAPGQGHLFAQALIAEAEEVAERTGVVGSVETRPRTAPKKKGGRRSHFPDHLPRVTSTFELPESERQCVCGGELHAIGVERVKELERIETAVVHEIERAKYACRKCENCVVTAPGPDRVIEKGLMGPGFLANVIVDRFGNHLPYHRLEKKYANEGLSLSRSVLERSAATCADLLTPIRDQLEREVLSAAAIYTDDTPVTIARGSTGGSRKGRVWIYLDGEDRHAYRFTESRANDDPVAVLGGYEGYIHADAYPGYDVLFGPGKATEVACRAHVRRKFVDAEGSEPELAAGAIERIGKVYGIERQAKEEGLDGEALRERRQGQSVPILVKLRAYLSGVEAQVLAKSPMATAVRYAQGLWSALNVYVTDGRLNIDNNPAERAIRPVAIGRKNWIFVQNLEGGRRMATLMSLVSTAKAIGINPMTYLRDVLVRLERETDVAKLTPHGWKEHFQAEVEERLRGAQKRLLGA